MVVDEALNLFLVTAERSLAGNQVVSLGVEILGSVDIFALVIPSHPVVIDSDIGTEDFCRQLVFGFALIDYLTTGLQVRDQSVQLIPKRREDAVDLFGQGHHARAVRKILPVVLFQFSREDTHFCAQ